MGVDDHAPDSLFQIGSVTKTMTGVLLAKAIGRGEVTASASVGDFSAIDRADPYAAYG